MSNYIPLKMFNSLKTYKQIKCATLGTDALLLVYLYPRTPLSRVMGI